MRRALGVGAGLLLLTVGAGADLTQLVHHKLLDDIEPQPRSRRREFRDAADTLNCTVRGMRTHPGTPHVRPPRARALVEKMLRDGDYAKVPQTVTASVLFVDLQGFTTLTERVGPVRTVDLLNAYFFASVIIIGRQRGVVIQFQADGIMAIFNVPVGDPDHAANASGAGRGET